mgnify:CR=1 FL=1
MKFLLGVTQRVQDNELYVERRDCLDQRWVSFLRKIEIIPIPIPNLTEDFSYLFDILGIKGILLTGGNNLPFNSKEVSDAPERDYLELKLLKYAELTQIPVLGVCRGFQIMNQYLGGSLIKIKNHVSTTHNLTFSPNFKDIFPKKVNSFHNYGINKSGIANFFEPVAFSPDGLIEAAFHKKLNWLGIMWHPERKEVPNEDDLNVFSRYLLRIER